MKKLMLTTSILTLGAFALITAAPSVLAYRGDPNVQGPNCSSDEQHQAMQQALENNDYNAWQNLHQGKGRISEVINESNFSKFVQMHQLRIEGKTDEANQIRSELGPGLNNGSGRQNGQHQGYGKNNQ